MNTATFGPYSTARTVGNLVFVSGQVGVNPATKTASGDVKAQTAQVLDNLSAVLATEGLLLDNVIKTTIYLKDMADFAAVNEIYAAHFHPPYPVRACVEVSGLPRVAGDTELLVEIEAIASQDNNHG